MSTIQEARQYVGTDQHCGRMQLNIFMREGLTRESNVLEIGCGCLNAGLPIMNFLTTGKYVGLEPNRWLVDAALQDPKARELVERCGARFLYRDDFDAYEAEQTFDFILSHSVLSHCAPFQVAQFFGKPRGLLRVSGTVVASFRMAEGNQFGSPGNGGKDSEVTEWQYPGVTWYRLETISRVAIHSGLVPMLRPQLTAFLSSHVPSDIHDWIVCKPIIR